MPITNGFQNHMWCREIAVVDEFESLRRGLFTVPTVLASREHSVGNKLIPLFICIWIGENAHIVHNLRAKVSQRLNELGFGWSLSADFCIDVYLYERRVRSIVFSDTFYCPLRGGANMRLIKALVVKLLVSAQYPQQLVLIFVRKLMRAIFSFFYWPTTIIRKFWLVWKRN